MTLRNKMAGFALTGLFAMTSVGTAAAQDPESGETGTWQQPQPTGEQAQPGGWQQQQNPPPQGGWQQPPQGGGQQAGWNGQPPAAGENEAPPASGTTPDATTGDSDHTSAVGHLGVGWFGAGGVTLGIGDVSVAVSTPAVGIRYWLSEGIGLDVAVGFGYTSTGGTVDSPDAVVDISGSSGFAMTVHGGLPISVYHGEHYSFQLVPEIDLGFGSGTIFGADANADQDVGAFFFQVGARAGAEIHFGFIGVPQLALQGTVGLALAYQSNTLENGFADMRGSTITTVNGFTLATTVQDEPWDIFTGSIRAIYYWF